MELDIGEKFWCPENRDSNISWEKVNSGACRYTSREKVRMIDGLDVLTGYPETLLVVFGVRCEKCGADYGGSGSVLVLVPDESRFSAENERELVEWW